MGVGADDGSVAVSTQDFPARRDGLDLLLLVNDLYVLSARPLDGFPPGHMSLSDPQRTWAGIALTDAVKVQIYDPFSQGGQAYLGSVDIEIGFAGRKREETPYDQDELGSVVIKVSHVPMSLDKTNPNRTLRTRCSRQDRRS